MKWAGLETPKCVTVHQRVKKSMKLLPSETRLGLRITGRIISELFIINF